MSVEVTYHALCTDCRPILPVPFSDALGAWGWASEHAPDTGHNVVLLIECKRENSTEIYADTQTGCSILSIQAGYSLIDYMNQPQVQRMIMQRQTAGWN